MSFSCHLSHKLSSSNLFYSSSAFRLERPCKNAGEHTHTQKHYETKACSWKRLNLDKRMHAKGHKLHIAV